ncbi:MAG: YceI family protein [Hyphomicrobiales bacterium]
MTVHRVTFGFLAAALIALPVSAQATEWSVQKGSSLLGFVATITGAARKGGFTEYDAKITLDPADLAASSVVLEIDVKSAATGEGQIDSALPSPDWFSVSEFPKATFASTEIRHKGGNVYEMDGTLKLRGVEKDLTVPFTLDINGTAAMARGEVELVRTDFGVGQGQFASSEQIAASVKVVFEFNATKAE